MEKMPKDPIKEFAETISRGNEVFKKQLKEVKGKYPLVMLAYRMQQAVITELSMPRFISDTEIGSLYSTIESVQTDSMVKLKVENQQRLADLKTCLMRAHTSDSSSGEQYLAAVDCFETFVAGDDREVVDDD